MAQTWHPVLSGADSKRIVELSERFAAQIQSCRVLVQGRVLNHDNAKERFMANPKLALLLDYETVNMGVLVPFFPMIGDYVLYCDFTTRYYCLKNGWIDDRAAATGFTDLSSAKAYLKRHPRVLEFAQVHYLPHNNSKPIKRFQPRARKAR